ncbi:hypothetical protein SCLCIDRAFT_31276 [Scleroderma citrinum Foug A]|uniref:Uncharacterized protein n=1 Tax=Scleroderma citrinum Foug A TaxID=1036808 RepID=A0A0C3D0C1_9AGAM|nr:hypothetical protein SCLCIDRAFT_31276 [Scleroderma citrinum Foug A]
MSNRRILAARADYVIRTWVYERVEWLMKKINTLFAIGSEQELKYILPENEVVYGIIRANIGKPSLYMSVIPESSVWGYVISSPSININIDIEQYVKHLVSIEIDSSKIDL